MAGGRPSQNIFEAISADPDVDNFFWKNGGELPEDMTAQDFAARLVDMGFTLGDYDYFYGKYYYYNPSPDWDTVRDALVEEMSAGDPSPVRILSPVRRDPHANMTPDPEIVVGDDPEVTAARIARLAEDEEEARVLIRSVLRSSDDRRILSRYGFQRGPVDATREFGGRVSAAMRHFQTNPFRHVKVFSQRKGKWYQNSRARPAYFTEM